MDKYNTIDEVMESNLPQHIKLKAKGIYHLAEKWYKLSMDVDKANQFSEDMEEGHKMDHVNHYLQSLDKEKMESYEQLKEECR